MSDITIKNNGEVSQSALVTADDFDDLGAGIRSSFPVISYRGSRWRLRYQGDEQMMLDDRGSPVPEIAVCFLKVPDHISKRYYPGWVEGQERKPPDCYSNDGIRPDPSLTPPKQPDNRPVPLQCSQCFFNEIGSNVIKDNQGKIVKKTKACADYKRVAVKLYYPIVNSDLVNQPMLLTVPPASLQNLKAYGTLLRDEQKVALARVTYVKLDDDLSYQKQMFRSGPPLSDEEFTNVRVLRNGGEVADIIRREAIEAAEPIQDGSSTVNTQGPAVQRKNVEKIISGNEQIMPPETLAMAPQPSPTRSPIPTPGARANPAGQAPVSRGNVVGMAPIPAARAVGGINAAVAKPAANPASTRVVQHPSVQPELVEQEELTRDGREEVGVSEDRILNALDTKFQDLMGRNKPA